MRTLLKPSVLAIVVSRSVIAEGLSAGRPGPMGRSRCSCISHHEFLAGDQGKLLALGVDGNEEV